MVPRRGNQLGEHAGVDRRSVSDTSLAITFSIRSARVKNRRAAATSRRAQSSTSMTWPYWPNGVATIDPTISQRIGATHRLGRRTPNLRPPYDNTT